MTSSSHSHSSSSELKSKFLNTRFIVASLLLLHFICRPFELFTSHLLIGMFMNALVAKMLKMSFRQRRPNNPPTRDENNKLILISPSAALLDDTLGFPSSHAMALFFASTLFTIRSIRDYLTIYHPDILPPPPPSIDHPPFTPLFNDLPFIYYHLLILIPFLLFLHFISFSLSYHRVKTGKHTWTQIAGGAIFGILFANLYYFYCIPMGEKQFGTLFSLIVWLRMSWFRFIGTLIFVVINGILFLDRDTQKKILIKIDKYYREKEIAEKMNRENTDKNSGNGHSENGRNGNGNGNVHMNGHEEGGEKRETRSKTRRSNKTD